MTTARSNIEVVAKAAVEAAPAYPSTIKQAVTTTAATDDGTINCGDGHRKKQSEVVGNTQQWRLRQHIAVQWSKRC